MNRVTLAALAYLGALAIGVPAGAAEQDKPALAQRAREIFLANCYRCHGQEGNAEGGLNYLLDRQQLVARKKVVPGDPDGSRLFQRVHSGEMPPEEETIRPSPNDVATLRQWIQEGAPDLQRPSPRRAF